MIADAPWLQSIGTRTCQSVHTSTAECANAGNGATKVGNKAGSRTLEPSWLHAITGCLAQPMRNTWAQQVWHMLQTSQ